MRARFYDGLTLAQTSERLSISTDYARRQTRRALFLLGRSPRLARFRERIIREGAYHGTRLAGVEIRRERGRTHLIEVRRINVVT